MNLAPARNSTHQQDALATLSNRLGKMRSYAKRGRWVSFYREFDLAVGLICKVWPKEAPAFMAHLGELGISPPLNWKAGGR